MVAGVVYRVLLLAIFLGVAVVLGGCAGPQPPALPPAPTLSPGALGPALESARDARWEGLSARFPEAQRPDTVLVRVVAPQEWAAVQAECLQGLGFDVIATSDNGLMPQSIPLEQQEGLEVAMYTCDAQYPTDPAASLPLTKDELSYIYDYFTDVLTPCLEAAGVEVPEPSSRSLFIETYTSGDAWDPYLNVSGTKGVVWEKINKTCPQTPPGLRQ